MSVSNFAQNITGSFDYQDCGCGGVVDLQIYNGLYGQFGGDRVPDTDEYTLGAITVANLNDTDGDGVVDNMDNDVTGTAAGRDEVDLMFMNITITSDVAPVCDSIRLIVSPGLEIWGSSVKRNRIGRSIAVSQLPLPVYVEAQRVSASVRDFSIVAGLVDENGSLIKGDTVRATGVWARFIANYNFANRTTSPTPSSLGVVNRDPGYLDTIVTTVSISHDNSIYGPGSHTKNALLTNDPLITGTDDFFGGRVLFHGELYPLDIKNELSAFNVKLDVARQIEINSFTIEERTGKVANVENDSFPGFIELPNDDDETYNPITGNGAGDIIDEDAIPSIGTEVFSFDSPGYQRINVSSAFLSRSLKFKEFIRISFGSIEPSGNIVEGSMCSSPYPWHLYMSLLSSGTVNNSYPNRDKHITLEPLGSSGIHTTKPRIPSSLNVNGVISASVNGLVNQVVDVYRLLSSKNVSGDIIWTLQFRAGNSNWSNVKLSNASPNGPWSITSSNVTVSMGNGTIPFRGNEVAYFSGLIVSSSVNSFGNGF